MGILETIEGKMDTLIAALNEHTSVMKQSLAAGGTTTAATTEEKPKTTRAKKTEPETPVNKIDEATLVAKFDQLKAIGGDIIPKLKKIIQDVGGVASLPELRQIPAKFDATYDALVALEASLSAPAEDDDL